APGVLVQVHDIFLPWDYRPDWVDRQYSEQYLLAAYLLGGGHRVEVILPNFYVFTRPRLAAILDPIWTAVPLTGYETAGHSLWMRTSDGVS
ncbi:MAG: class I SAM-dependent methyltransferase, partial [Candidatus Dormibacteraeota bacterium]|nr:class I SAM-dependent methyltransferase [Candidatus Dormibacteraeota bacterium]